MSTSKADRPIALLHIVDVLALAGMEYGVMKLLNRLPFDRFRPIICCLRFRSEVITPLLDPRVRVVELNRRPGRDWTIVRKLETLMRDERVDIVHSHNWPTFLYSTLATGFARVPVFLHGEHGHEDPNAPRRHLWTKRLLSPRPDRLTAVSADIAAELTQHWRVPAERVLTVPNGVDLARFGMPVDVSSLRRDLDLDASDLVVMNIGSHRPVKDHGTLLRAFARARREQPRAKLVLAGKGEWADFVEEADRLGVRDAVRLPGIRHDIPELLRLCDVYVNSSTFEGMSNTILEAMAASCPVIATSVGGNPELVREGETGHLVPAGDDAAMGSRLGALLGDSSARAALGAAGRERVERHHSIDSMVTAYRDLYEETLARADLRRRSPVREGLRRWSARAIRLSGLSRLKRQVEAQQLLILTYHRVLPLHDAQRYPYAGMVMPRDIFEAQVAHLARNYTVLPFSTASRLLKEGRLPPRATVVTFDDGYRDNYEHAWPILKKYGVPAILFVVTGALDRELSLWWDEVADASEALAMRRALPTPAPTALPGWASRLLDAPGPRPSARNLANAFVRRLNETKTEERREVVRALTVLAATGSRRDDRMLHWDEVREMHAQGLEIGGHTVTHAFLDEVDEETGRREIETCLARIREELGRPTPFFCYPRGRVSDEAKRLLEAAGVEVAVTTEPDTNTQDTALLQLKRFDAGYSRLNSGFDASVFEVELQGWFQILRRPSKLDRRAHSAR